MRGAEIEMKTGRIELEDVAKAELQEAKADVDRLLEELEQGQRRIELAEEVTELAGKLRESRNGAVPQASPPQEPARQAPSRSSSTPAKAKPAKRSTRRVEVEPHEVADAVATLEDDPAVDRVNLSSVRHYLGLSDNQNAKVREALETCEREGTIERNGSYKGQPLYATKKGTPDPEPAPAASSTPPAPVAAPMLPPMPVRPRTEDAEKERRQERRSSAESDQDLLIRDVDAYLKEHGPSTGREIHEGLELADRGVSRHRIGQLLGRGKKAGRVKVVGSRGDTDVVERIPPPAEQEGVTISQGKGNVESMRLYVMEALELHGACTVDELAQLLEEHPADVGTAASTLTRQGRIQKQPGGKYRTMARAAA